jgi:putative phosphotransacetylase
VREDFALEFHVDTDEANAAMLNTGDFVYIVEF